ncbi:MAG: ribosome recycling factor [Candidatus Sumerlaeota bacterium]|nr:ribosome recycling factor [Candidatus Sumerlaeota bacterium]
MLEAIKKDAREKMDKALKTLEHHFETLRTGRASLSIVQDVKVDPYNSGALPLNQVASLSTPDAKSIVIQPWDKSVIGLIEKAILAANLGITPANDGTLIRLVVPPMTEERRKEVVKHAHKVAEEARVSIRNVRRHVNEEIKKNEKKHEITEDDRDRLLKEIQTQTDDHIKKIDAMLAAKEKEIMAV